MTVIPTTQLLNRASPYENRRWWKVKAPGRTIIGGPHTRPLQIINGKIMFCSIKEPMYGAGWGFNGQNGTLTAQNLAGGTLPADTAKIREVWFRESTNERSLAGEETAEFATIANSKIDVLSTSATPSSELYITHREFYVWLESLGAYYRGASIPYDTGGGATAKATGYVGSIASAAITNGGSSYETAPDVAFTHPNPATGTAVFAGYATSFTVTAGGSGYVSALARIPYGETYINTTVTIVDGAITAITPIGSPTSFPFYSNDDPPTVEIVGDGTGATATVNVTWNDYLDRIELTSGGGGYSSVPTVSLSGGVGSGATFTATVTSNAVSAITKTANGSGYDVDDPPTVVIAGGTGSGATAVAVVSGQVVTGVVITAGGSGYLVAQTVTISGGGGSGATATTTVGTGALTSVYVTAGGAGYTNAPIVTAQGGGGSGAKFESTVSSGAVSAIAVGSGGTGYTTEPTIQVGGGATISMTAAQLRNQRPLEDFNQTSVFPAVATADFYRGRLVGGGLIPRVPANGSIIKFTRDSNTVTIEGDTFHEADVHKGIVDYDTNEIVAFIDRVLTTTTARITIPSTTTVTTWPYPSRSIVKWGLSGDDTLMYTTPIYVGEAAGGLTYGVVTWNPLDTIRDDAFYASGAKIKAIKRMKEDLVVFYDCGIAVYQGQLSVGTPPNLRSFIASDNMGAFAPDGMWQDAQGTLWFYGQGRLYRCVAGQIEDVSRGMGVAGLWSKFVHEKGGKRQIVSYNPELNAAVIVGLRKKSDAAADAGKYYLYIDHDGGRVCAGRFPVKLNCIHCYMKDDGHYQWVVGGKNCVYNGFVPDVWTDTYYNTSDVLQSTQAVPYSYTTGIDWFGAQTWLRGLQMVIETAVAAPSITFAVQARDTNLLNAATFTATATHTLDAAALNVEEYRTFNVAGRGLQYKWSGASSGEMTFVQAGMRFEGTDRKGVGRQGM